MEQISAGFREFILCAAVHYQDGKAYKEQPLNIESGLVVLGRRHNNCFGVLENVIGFDINKIEHKDFGFITSTNRFVTRKEGMIIANREGQIYHTVPYREGDILTSEDLYQDND